MKNLGFTLFVMIAITIVSEGFKQVGFSDSNIILLYVLGVVIISRYASQKIWGVGATVLSVLMFNYFFIDPIYTFAITSKEYVVIFMMMFGVSAITATLTNKVKQEAKMSKEKEMHTQKLYEMSKMLLKAQNLEQTKITIAVSIAELMGCNVIIYTSKNFEYPFIYWIHEEGNKRETVLLEEEKKLANKAFLTRENVYSKKHKVSYLPIIAQQQVLGVIGLADMYTYEIDKAQKGFLDVIIAQAGMVLAREYSILEQQELQMTIESEQLKNNMLRAISHDIRTPLTGIIGATSTLIKNKQVMGEETQNGLLTSIYEDGLWLLDSIENILNFTRLDDGRLVLHKHVEVVEEIVETAIQKLNKRDYTQHIQVEMPEDVLFLPMDAILIVQVIYNLLDNAIKYTPEESVIELKVYTKGNHVYFEIIDRGMGIKEEDRIHLFEKFYRVKQDKKLERSGIGLGLTICKGIIEAHQGSLTTFNNHYGGATFQFILPMEEEENGIQTNYFSH